LVDYLTRSEIEAVLGAANKKTWVGRCDHAILLTAVQTGLRRPARVPVVTARVSRMSPTDCIVRGYDSIQVALPLPDDRDLQVIQAAAGESPPST